MVQHVRVHLLLCVMQLLTLLLMLRLLRLWILMADRLLVRWSLPPVLVHRFWLILLCRLHILLLHMLLHLLLHLLLQLLLYWWLHQLRLSNLTFQLLLHAPQLLQLLLPG